VRAVTSTAPGSGIKIVFECGRTWRLDELPPRAIALDGAVRGPFVDVARGIYSFDHHDGCIRHVTLSTCEQVRDALLVGLDPAGFSVFVNDVDADTVLSTWLLQHPQRLRGEGSARLRRMLHRVGRVDALGPGWGRAHPLTFLTTPSPSVVRTRALLDSCLALVERWWRGEKLPPLPPPPPATGLWLQQGRVCRAPVRGGLRTLYRRAGFGVVAFQAPLGSTAYTVGKQSEFIDFDVPAFLAACNALEPGWGGGSTIGGSPRHPDGSRSRLSLDAVAAVLADVTAATRT